MEYFDAVYCICMADRPGKRDFLLKQIKHFYPDLEPIVFDAVNTRHVKGKGHHVGCAMSHRNVMLDAKTKGFKRIVVFEEDAMLHKDFKNILSKAVAEIQDKQWDLFYLGAHCQRKIRENPFPKEENCQYLLKPSGMTCTHGICYNETFYDWVINRIPNDIQEAKDWCMRAVAIDQWFRNFQNTKNENYKKYSGRYPVAYIVDPIIATQHFMTTLYGKDCQDDIKNFLTKDNIK
jgi:GR25 family glycosyltransferase involved in LPS biosynthesis